MGFGSSSLFYNCHVNFGRSYIKKYRRTFLLIGFKPSIGKTMNQWKKMYKIFKLHLFKFIYEKFIYEKIYNLDTDNNLQKIRIVDTDPYKETKSQEWTLQPPSGDTRDDRKIHINFVKKVTKNTRYTLFYFVCFLSPVLSDSLNGFWYIIQCPVPYFESKGLKVIPTEKEWGVTDSKKKTNKNSSSLLSLISLSKKRAW